MISNNLFCYLQTTPEPNQIQKDSYLLIPTNDSLNSHIRVDKTFSPDCPYLPFAHYTVIVHGRHIHVSFHNNGTTEPFPDSAELVTEEILNCAESARIQLDSLIKQFNEKLTELDTEYSQQEQLLSASSNITERKRHFHACCKALEIRSQLLSEADPRLTLLQSMESYFIHEAPLVESPALPLAPTSASDLPGEDSHPQTAPASIPAPMSHNQECAHILQKLKKSNILQKHHLLQKLSALICYHKITPCLDIENHRQANMAVKEILSHEELAIKLLNTHPMDAYSYAKNANPTKVFSTLFTDTTITTEQIHHMVKYLCSHSAIYNYLLTNFYFSDPTLQDSTPLFYTVIKTQPASKDKMALIDFMLARPLPSGFVHNGKTTLFILLLSTLAQESSEYTTILEKVLKSGRFSTESGLIVANISGDMSPGKKLLPKDLKVFDAVEKTSSFGRKETFYRYLPTQPYLNASIIELAANRASFSELTILLTSAGYFNPDILTRFACGMEAITKGNIGLAVGNDAIEQYQSSDHNYRMITLFTKIKPTAVLESIPHIISEMMSRLTASGNPLVLLQKSYEALADYQTQQLREQQLSILPAIAMNLCAQIALSLTPSTNAEQLYDWATRFEKPLVTLTLFGSFGEMMQKIKRTIVQMLILRVDHPSFEAEHQDRLKKVVSAALKKDKAKAESVLEAIQGAIGLVHEVASPSDTAVINEVARKCIAP